MQKVREYHGHFGTVQDDVYCPGDTMLLFMQNKRLPCPVMMGRTASEFFIAPQADTKEELVAAIRTALQEDADAFLSHLDVEHSSLEELRQQASMSSIALAAHALCRANAKNGAGTDLYYYSFDAEIPGWDHPGTFHSVDLWFFFETLAKCWRPFTGKHYDLARLMCNYWANFIKTGDPNGRDADGSRMPQWEKFTPDTPNAMYFGDGFVEYGREEPSDLMKFLVKEYYKKN